jgi:hypothetical protein
MQCLLEFPLFINTNESDFNNLRSTGSCITVTYRQRETYFCYTYSKAAEFMGEVERPTSVDGKFPQLVSSSSQLIKPLSCSCYKD